MAAKDSNEEKKTRANPPNPHPRVGVSRRWEMSTRTCTRRARPVPVDPYSTGYVTRDFHYPRIVANQQRNRLQTAASITQPAGLCEHSIRSLQQVWNPTRPCSSPLQLDLQASLDSASRSPVYLASTSTPDYQAPMCTSFLTSRVTTHFMCMALTPCHSKH